MNSVNRVALSFWIFGLLNNVLYVIILSAAWDLVGSEVPKAVVLLPDIVPGFLVKIAAPFFIHRISYNHRLFAMVMLSCLGMFTVARNHLLAFRIAGIICASASSGLGELTFLQLTHFYPDIAVHYFSSGTGMAGLGGAFLYFLLTSLMRLQVQTALVISAFFPLGFLFVYFALLPDSSAFPVDQPYERVASPAITHPDSVAHTIKRLKSLFLPYMLPLASVYIAEYTLNQGVSPTLLFPIKSTPFTEYRDIYVAYSTLYQLGVFISRSSASFVRIKNLHLLAVLQAMNLALAIWQSMFMFLPSIYWTMLLIFYEGLLGGAAYVNTFLSVRESTHNSQREFAMGAVGISDSAGIVCAAIISLYLEPALCGYQVSTGRNWCRSK
ncbi:hypothetical protein CANCADRAFT_3100 [Tortispora caseinolytica NRRL Y-17796]|uniref:Protein BTN n=1 Tax=Tortispora caseinolytica NRRL Y-17796 TaxID=767744 RepID=A0A1E4TI07_9ASCO|nr:hypothetical protein CANCADRAFT_3100 [Tortispora caseinolytica NRRL Y-17796]